ncbi:hypothetical protein [Nannocystis sp.]|uniref:hypothetical protein n=1 Tax=Nannocystis sp. TaxID=1962667 RepID=UPI0025EAF95C|nr:hypothetical protein [Nannocystis sp.]MBK7825174.1 hypothetical protein [Nannocystis sp.]
MKNPSLALSLGLTLGLSLFTAGCGDNGSSDDSSVEKHPQETKWKKVVDNLPFPLSGDGQIYSISVGRLDYNNNFANRGDVEVFLDQDAEVISVEMQYYDFSDDITTLGDEAQGVVGTFDRMSLWAFVNSGNPAKPDSMPPEDNCTVDTWKSGCTIYVYYDGQSQPARAGAHIRVHLPKAYRGELNITTEDNVAESTFPRVGNITVDGICGSGSIYLAQGNANIKMCRELTPAPACSAEQIKGCEDFVDPDTMMPAAWSNLCPCPAENFGQLKIEALKPWAGNITVDIPTTTWLNANLANEETDKPHECKPELPACAGKICSPVSADDYTISGEFNYPSKAAASGAGFNLTVKSAGCNPVTYFKSADDWSEVEADSKPTTETRGHITVCSGCIK